MHDCLYLPDHSHQLLSNKGHSAEDAEICISLVQINQYTSATLLVCPYAKVIFLIYEVLMEFVVFLLFTVIKASLAMGLLFLAALLVWHHAYFR